MVFRFIDGKEKASFWTLEWWWPLIHKEYQHFYFIESGETKI